MKGKRAWEHLRWETERAKPLPCPFAGLRAEGSLPCRQGPGPRCAQSWSGASARMAWTQQPRWAPKEPQGGDRGGTTLFQKVRLSSRAPCQPQKELSVCAARVTGCRIHPPRSASFFHLTFRVILLWRCSNNYSCFPDEDWGLRMVTSTQNHEAAK